MGDRGRLLICGHSVRGALAGNGEQMAVATERRAASTRKSSSKKKSTATNKKPRSKTGGKPTKRATTRAARPAKLKVPETKPEEPENRTEEECPDGAALLRVSANIEVAAHSKSIAAGLSAAAARGNPACAKLLLDLLAGKKVSSKKVERAMTLAQELERDAEWKGEKQGTVVTE